MQCNLYRHCSHSSVHASSQLWQKCVSFALSAIRNWWYPVFSHYITAKKGCFDSIWLPQFHTSSASLNTVETTDYFTFQPVIRFSRTLVNVKGECFANETVQWCGKIWNWGNKNWSKQSFLQCMIANRKRCFIISYLHTESLVSLFKVKVVTKSVSGSITFCT